MGVRLNFRKGKVAWVDARTRETGSKQMDPHNEGAMLFQSVTRQQTHPGSMDYIKAAISPFPFLTTSLTNTNNSSNYMPETFNFYFG